MHESKKFIEIQIRLAERLIELSTSRLNEVVEAHTVFRQILGMPYGNEIRNQPLWHEFIKGLEGQSDRVNWAYEFHLRHLPAESNSDDPSFGCFSFDFHFRPVVRLHFGNPRNERVLNKESVASRKDELKQMFTYIRRIHPEAERVRGSSWLYNVEAYRRLFPTEYVETATPVGYETGFFSLWGQFLKGDRSVREGMAEPFLDCLSKQTSVDGCMQCFPYEVLRPECAIEPFYRFYGVD